MPENPIISVLITVYNGMPHLEDAIDSVLTQTLSDFEVIIVDDGSSDDTPEFLSGLTDPRIRVISQPNAGTAAAANRGLRDCRGRYVARMDADDITLPERFAAQVTYLDQHPEIGALGGFTQNLGESRLGAINRLPVGHEEIRAGLLAGRHAMSHPTMMIRREPLETIGGYWSYRLVDDWDMMLRLSEVTRLANLPEVLLHYRVHRGSLNGSNMARMRFSIDFAIARAEAREGGRDEPSLEAFEGSRAARKWTQKLADAAAVRGLSHYRQAVAEHAGPTPLKAAPHYALSGLLLPTWVLRRVAKKFGRVDTAS